MAMEEGAFENRGIQLEWTEVPEGTGRMCEMLRKDETDLAIILTEGIVKSIAEGNAVRIVQGYIDSPLLWGIHVGAASAYQHPEDLRGKKAAVSRLGSGSHLMAYLHARELGWDPNTLAFEIVNNLDGGVNALSNGTADYFLWEHFTTKPLVDKGVFRRLGDFPTPWPCFVVAAQEEFTSQTPALVRHILEVINLYTKDFREIPSIDRTLAHRYKQEVTDIRQWLDKTRWSQCQIPNEVIEHVIDSLLDLKLISDKKPATSLLANPGTPSGGPTN